MRFINWLKKVIMSALNSIKNLFVETVQNIESVVILSFSAIGLTTILSEIPFHYALPAFIDAPLIIPVIAVLTILLLITIMQMRINGMQSV